MSIWEEREPQRTFGPVAYSLQTSLAERHRDQQQSSAEKKEIRRAGKSCNVQPLKQIEVLLDALELKLAVKLGEGDLTLGIHRALILTGMRQF